MSQSNGHSNRSDRSSRSNSSSRGDRKPSPHQPVILSADEIARLLVPSAGRQRLVVMVGIPGSGKSTIAGVIEKQGGYVRLSFDDVRAQLFGNAEDHGEEGQVGKEFRAQLRAAFTGGKSVVVDNTNFLIDMRTQVIDIARECGVTDVHLLVMRVPLPVCLQRNRARDRVVPTRTVRHMYWKLSNSEWPTGKEGRMTIVRPGPKPDNYSVGGFAAAYAQPQHKPKEKRMTSESQGFVRFGDAACKIGIQSQYASRYVAGGDGYANCGSDPELGRVLRFRGDPGDYHGLEIHADDVDEFAARVKAAKQKEGGLFAFLNREKEGSDGE